MNEASTPLVNVVTLVGVGQLMSRCSSASMLVVVVVVVV